MKKATGINKVFSKPALRYVVRSLPDQDYKLNWNHEEDDSILSIYDYKSKQISVATFINGDQLIFKHLDSTNPRVISVFEEVLGISLKNSEQKTFKTLYLEMDYHLMELYEYIQAKDHSNIKMTKAKLIFLREKMEKFQSS